MPMRQPVSVQEATVAALEPVVEEMGPVVVLEAVVEEIGPVKMKSCLPLYCHRPQHCDQVVN